MSIPSFLLLDNSSTERFAETSFPGGKVTGPPFGASTKLLTPSSTPPQRLHPASCTSFKTYVLRVY